MNRCSIDQAKSEIIQKVAEVETLARRMYPAYASRPKTSITFKMKGRAAGTANYRDQTVMLNLGQAVQSDAIARLTVPHEIAHLATRHLYPAASAHGREWRTICRALGGDGQRCYNAEERGVTVVKGRQTMQYLYHTTIATDVWVGPVHHARLQKNGHDNPMTGRPGYHLRTATGHQIVRSGFQYKSRAKA
jgi:predicted SprT family Zn-dependent metalloprotease